MFNENEMLFATWNVQSIILNSLGLDVVKNVKFTETSKYQIKRLHNWFLKSVQVFFVSYYKNLRINYDFNLFTTFFK